jgi:hypothetical protein
MDLALETIRRLQNRIDFTSTKQQKSDNLTNINKAIIFLKLIETNAPFESRRV